MTCEKSLATERSDQKNWDPSLTYLIWFQNTKDGDGENAHHRPMDNVMVAKSTAAVVFMTLATYFELHQLCILYIEETSTQISCLDSTGAQSSRCPSSFPRLLYECLPTWIWPHEKGKCPLTCGSEGKNEWELREHCCGRTHEKAKEQKCPETSITVRPAAGIICLDKEVSYSKDEVAAFMSCCYVVCLYVQ